MQNLALQLPPPPRCPTAPTYLDSSTASALRLLAPAALSTQTLLCRQSVGLASAAVAADWLQTCC